MSTRKDKNRQEMNELVSRPKRLCTTNRHDDGEINDGEEKDDVEACTCTIDRLDDFSLLQIFNRLDIRDLCNAAEVNHQFKRVSKISFVGRYTAFDYQHSSASCRRVLCKFGDLIKSMKCEDSYSYPVDLSAISKFCAGTMDDLNLESIYKLKYDKRARSLFSSLKTLTIDCTSIEDYAGALLSECQELKILRLTVVPYTTSVSEVAQKYRKLEELYIGSNYYAAATFALLQNNRQIRKLDMPDYNANETIYAIASQMDRLEELVLRHYIKPSDYDNVTELTGLKSLKMLELHGVSPHFDAAIQTMENVPLACFKWFDCPPDLQFTKRIARLKTLKRLALTGISLSFDDCLTELSEQLPLLHELELAFKHQEKPLFSIGGLITFVEQSTKLDALVIHTIHSALFNQQFYDALLEAIQRRRSSSSSPMFKVTIVGPGLVSPQMHNYVLQVKLVESGHCSCSHCNPPVVSIRDRTMFPILICGTGRREHRGRMPHNYYPGRMFS